MNRLAHHPSQELLSGQPTSEPHSARRSVRYTAATNTQQAIFRQFPGLFAGSTTTQTGQPQARNSQNTQDHNAS